MEQIQRLQSDIIHDYNDITTLETNCLTNECISTFEELSNELIYEVFEYLDLHYAFQAFYDLNQRFQNLFLYPNLPIKINISSISKSTFHYYLTDIIIPHADRIKSFRLSNPFVADMSLLLPAMTNLTRLETLVINNIESNYIEGIVNHLSSLPVLSSLTIISIDSIKNQNDIYQKIFHLPTLKYCQISIGTLRHRIPLPIATNEFSSIEHLVIKNKVLLNQIDSLLSYVPQLRRLSLDYLDGFRSSQKRMHPVNLNDLTNVSLKLYSIDFNRFEQLVRILFRQVQVLRIVADYTRFSTFNMEYLNADQWEQLISTHMPNLRIFDFQHQYRSWYNNHDRQAYETRVNKFNSVFWIKRQWFFEYQYDQTKSYHVAIFYSINPYRRKSYMLYEELDKNVSSLHVETSKDSVQHVYIHNTNAMEQCLSYFPNAIELTLSETFHVPRDSIVISLNRIIPLRQLTKLTFDYHHFPFEQVIELLHFTPNVHTLKLDSILLYQRSSFLIEQNEIFQKVSKMNTITSVTIGNETTLEEIQLVVALFPRLKCLTINLDKEDLKTIARFLLSKPNNNTDYLSTLCVSKQQRGLFTILVTLIESEKLLDDYTIKVINQKLYLWW
ncbi:unnamed protein product [Rotaria sp. Silwood1]|nr:unnamed protein product [Rotaria sp. Silwood1]